MKTLLESGKIEEIKVSQNIAYILNDSSLFNLTDYKFLKSPNSNGLVKCTKVLYNGKIKLIYFSSGQKSFKNMIPSLDSNSFIKIISNILKTVLYVKNYGFLSCNNLDLSFDKIFVDSRTLAVSLIYLPINSLNDDLFAFENELRSGFIKVITSAPLLDNTKMSRIISYLSNSELSFSELCENIDREIEAEKVEPKEPPLGSQPTLIFSCTDTQNPISFKINTPKYIIGKNPAKVDGVISFNPAIGRAHCRFIYRNNNYYIIDGDGIKSSTNGTYINGERIEDLQPHSVKNGDIIRLANSDFTVQI